MNEKQYRALKKESPGALLLFKVGDFHELYFEDAQIAGRVLGLTLTTRGKNTDSPMSMAGFPYHQTDAYLAKLIQEGFRVAIIDSAVIAREPKTRKPKFKPNSATRVFVSNEAGDDEEFDICLGEKITGSESLLITQDLDNPKLFQLTHRNTGYALLRTALDYAETKDRGEKFWSRLPDKIRKLYDESDDPSKIFNATPAHLRNAVRSGKFE